MKTPKWLKVTLATLLACHLSSADPVWPPETFSCYYGEITEQAVSDLKDLDLVIVHPGDDGKNLDQSKVERLKKEGKDRTIVGYVSIGEDDRPPGGPPTLGQDTSGPSFMGKAAQPQKAHNGYASQFLDQQKFLFGEDGFLQFGPDGKPLMAKGQDGHPDENGVWGSYYVRADDPAWRANVFQTMDDLDKLGVDGFFLDTVDTASPWGDYGWTSAAMLDFVKAIRARYPEKKIVGNRGLFYLSQNDQYAELLDAVLFESLLTHYNWESERGDVSPWAKGHVEALVNDVMPAQKRTGLHLLVLDYLNPKQKDSLALVQSDRTLLKETPHSLSFSHPSLMVAGWTSQDLLPDAPPAAWPTLSTLEVQEEKQGAYTLVATFDSPIPGEAYPDVRVTTDKDTIADHAAQLPPAQITSWEVEGQTLTLKGDGLDKDRDYRAYLRLISKSNSPQTGFGWLDFHTNPSDLPSQITDLSNSSEPNGVALSFRADSLLSKICRVYLIKDNEKELLAETTTSPVLLSNLEIGDVNTVSVVGVTEHGQEGYPSLHHVLVRKDVAPPSPPGSVSVSQSGQTTTFRWQAAPGAEGYRLYVIPEGQSFRLPLLTSETQAEVCEVIPGQYTVFLTAVDGSGNQSRPGPSTKVTIE